MNSEPFFLPDSDSSERSTHWPLVLLLVLNFVTLMFLAMMGLRALATHRYYGRWGGPPPPPAVVSISLHQAATMSTHEVQRLLDQPHDPNELDATGHSPLWFAVNAQQLQIVELLLEHGADPNLSGPNSSPPIVEAVNQYALRGQFLPEIVKRLLEAGADPTDRDPATQSTPLHLVAQSADIATAKELLAWGAEVDAEDSIRTTPLMTAVLHGEPQMAELLLSHGADPDHRNSLNQTPRGIAANDGQMRDVFARHDQRNEQQIDAADN